MLQSQYGITSRQIFTGGIAYDQYALSTSKYGDGYDSYWEFLKLGSAVCEGIFGGGGTEASPITIATAGKWISIHLSTTALTGDNRLMYLWYYLTGDGSTTGGGECLRAMTRVDAAVGTAHGAHLSLSFGAAGSLTGLGVAGRNTLMLPNHTPVGGTLAALQAEIWSDGAISDPAGSLLSFIRVVNGGNATGMADVDTDAFLFELSGLTAGSGKLWDSTVNTAGPQIDHTFKVRLPDGATGYLPVMDNADGS